MTGAAHQTFYAQIAANKRQSVLLALIVAALLGLLAFAIGYGVTGSSAASVPIFAGVVILSLLVAVGTLYAGDSLVLAASQAREVGEGDAPQLINVVRELAIAADVPMPRVYVIGHELSHVRNYDIRFTLLVGVLVGSVALLADMFLRLTFWGGGRSRSRSGGGGGVQAVIFVLALALAILAPIAARLVQLAVSRQREYLADASSVEVTRNPRGLERALLKIAGDKEVLEVANRATQHLYIVNPIKKFEQRASGLFSTHPPIIDRVNRLRALTGEAPLDSADPALVALD